jgi:hypothetical protein
MPQLRFPKRDTEGLPSIVADNDYDTYITIYPGDYFTVNYDTSKHIYAIIMIHDTTLSTVQRYMILEVTEDGVSYSRIPSLITSSFVRSANRNNYWIVNRTVIGWRIRNSAYSSVKIREIIVLTPDDTKPYLNILYPDTVEIIYSGTTNFYGVSNLSHISDGDDSTYATFYFPGGHFVYTLYLQGTFSIPMASIISPFVLIEIEPGVASGLPTAIDDNKSHGYFIWGSKDSIPAFASDVDIDSPLNRSPNSPKLFWSQRVYEYFFSYLNQVRGVFAEDFLSPTTYYSSTYARTAVTNALNLKGIVNNPTLYVPYFFSLYHRPLFIFDLTNYIAYATDDLSEPFVYTAANGSTGRIYLRFGLRLEASSSPVSGNFQVKIYGMGFLCFPQMDFEVPRTFPDNAVWFDHIPLGGVTRDNNEDTESPDITTNEKFVSIYPVALDVSPGRILRYRIRSTSDEASTFNLDRYYGFHQVDSDSILWYYERDFHWVDDTLESFDVTGEDRYGQTKVIKVEITPT